MKKIEIIKRLVGIHRLSSAEAKTVVGHMGGLSASVALSPEFYDYTKRGSCFGYIGSSCRTAALDKVIEQILRDRGLDSNGIACWLTSTSVRHLMDGVDRKTSLKQFEKRVFEYTMEAMVEVAVWSHPDHCGSYASTLELRDKLATSFAETAPSNPDARKRYDLAGERLMLALHHMVKAEEELHGISKRHAVTYTRSFAKGVLEEMLRNQ
jgi:hypothetical protein